LTEPERGEIELSPATNEGRCRTVVVARGDGPGIADLGLAMRDGYSTTKSGKKTDDALVLVARYRYVGRP
jgi:hypothetical protein